MKLYFTKEEKKNQYLSNLSFLFGVFIVAYILKEGLVAASEHEV